MGLRVWRTESLYLNAIEKQVRTFAGMVVKHIVSIMEETKTTGPSGKACFFFTGTEINDRLAKDFADVSLYSDQLMNEIYKQGRVQTFDDLTLHHTFLSYLGFIFAIRKGYSVPLTGQVVLDSPVMVERQDGLIVFDSLRPFSDLGHRKRIKRNRRKFLF